MKTTRVLVVAVVVLSSVSGYLAVDRVRQGNDVPTVEMRGHGHFVLPKKFKAEVDRIIRISIEQERARNVAMYVTNGAVVVRAQTVVGVQSNQIVQLMLKAGL